MSTNRSPVEPNACHLLDSHSVLFMTIPVPWACWGNACEVFGPQTGVHTTCFLPECCALGPCKISPTSSVEPILLIELPSNIKTKKRCWLHRSFTLNASSKMKIQVEFLSSILSSEIRTAEGALTQKIQLKSQGVSTLGHVQITHFLGRVRTSFRAGDSGWGGGIQGEEQEYRDFLLCHHH